MPSTWASAAYMPGPCFVGGVTGRLTELGGGHWRDADDSDDADKVDDVDDEVPEEGKGPVVFLKCRNDAYYWSPMSGSRWAAYTSRRPAQACHRPASPPSTHRLCPWHSTRSTTTTG